MQKPPRVSGRPHPLDDARFNGATILISGSNFGCGSSHEYASQTLYRYGFLAIIADSLAQIFFGNSITHGIPCVKMSNQDIAYLVVLIERVEEIGAKRVFTVHGFNEEFAGDLRHFGIDALALGGGNQLELFR